MRAYAMVYFVSGILITLIIVSLIRGYKLKDIVSIAIPGIRDALVVAVILLLIGCLTGLWRVSGTIAYFITMGIKLLPPSLFVLSAFLLSALMSLAIGTSFGVAATAGVILMSIARAGDINLIPVAGAIMSGIYVGDRNSPAASSAALVASVTGTNINKNIRIMFRSAAIPVNLCIIIYTLLSVAFPLGEMNTDSLVILNENFKMNWLCIVPAALMIALPLCKVKVKTAMIIDIIVSFLIAVFIQKAGVAETLKAMTFGYESSVPELSSLLDGGGVKSMISVIAILIISGSFADIMNGTGLLDGVYGIVDKMKNKTGRVGTMMIISVISSMILCNQTIGVMMVNKISGRLYDETEKYQKMLDIENSVIVIAGLVPWCIACSVPLNTLGVNASVLPFSCFLWIVPLWHMFTKGRRNSRQKYVQ